ncbi:MAG: restriction endonuclease subunit S, partial [Variovorax sp.]
AVYRGGSPRPIQNYITDSPDGVNWIKIGDIGVGAKYIDSTAEKILAAGVSRSRQVKVGDFLLSNVSV